MRVIGTTITNEKNKIAPQQYLNCIKTQFSQNVVQHLKPTA
jgi:hypothetical protein